jgi:pimeloyl-ACP methyl ester carboxylesterase
MVCLHGFLETWRTWELVLPALERRHDVLAPTLAGHAGGPPLAGQSGTAAVADAVERGMDEAGFETAHLIGNSLGGHVALRLAARGRARTVVALAPAGGWSDDSSRDLLRFQATLVEQTRPPRPMRTRWSRRPRDAAAPPGTSRRTSSTSRPSCSPTSCEPSRRAASPRSR